MRIEKHSVARLIANTQEIPSAIKLGDWEKRVAGCHVENCIVMGICPCHAKTLIHPNNAPPTAIGQLYRKLGAKNRSTSRINAVRSRIETVIRMNMQS